jgi:hypothetical protein
VCDTFHSSAGELVQKARMVRTSGRLRCLGGSSVTASELLAHVHRHGVTLTVVGDALRVRSKSGPLPNELLAELKDHKRELLELLCRQVRPLAYNCDALEERAAILEHEAGLPREEADAQALSATVPRSLAVAEAVRGRVWRVTLRDGTACAVIVPEPMTQAEAEVDIRRGPLGHRVVRVEEHRVAGQRKLEGEP